MSGNGAKEIYDRRKRLRQERLLREEETAALQHHADEEGEILFASLAASMERIAAALEQLAGKRRQK